MAASLPSPTATHQTHPTPLIAAARPFLKWAGGKSRLLEQYQPFLPSVYDRYHEPFLGGGALFFHLAPQLHQQGKKAFLSDLKRELVNVYQCVRDRVTLLREDLAQHLNKTCYNGLYRENSKGHFNVPIGRYKNPKVCAPALLKAASAALQIADISERPFTAVAERAQGAQDFVYFDPPYHPLSETSKFTAYSRYRFGEEEQTTLKELIEQLRDRTVTVLASNSDCPFIRDLYKDFKIETITAARSINSKASKRGKITEVLVVA